MRRALECFEDREAMGRAVALAFVEAARAVESFTVALAGGRTVEPLYRSLASELQGEVQWERVHVFWSDERYVSPTDPMSNVRLVRELLLNHVPIPEENVHAPQTDLTEPGEAARRYEEMLREHSGLDWVLLGLGEDGHVASLFPGRPELEERQRLVVAVLDSPKPPPVRLTLTPATINAAREVHLLVAGASKRAALEAILDGKVLDWTVENLTIWTDHKSAASA
ncbi:MAG: 6-phosphogluconolactonase [Acidobacteria bacterium]|nr:MAG: 6-phosphogluconolactonase [Acidobacteriota bacterium]